MARRADAQPARPRSRTLIVGVAAWVCVALVFLAARDRPPWADLETASLDWRFHLRATLPPSPHVALVMIDDRSIAELGWPVPRAVLAQTVSRLDEAGAAVIVVDLLLGDAAPAHPFDDGDRALAEALRNSGRAVLAYAFLFDGRRVRDAPHPPAIEAAAFRLDKTASPTPMLRPQDILPPAPLFAAAAATLGHVNVFLDSDGVVRWEQAAILHGDSLYPSLAVEAVRLRDGVAKGAALIERGVAIRQGSRTIPIDPQGRFAVNHYGPRGTFPTYALIDVVEGGVLGGAVENRIVLIGSSVSAGGDSFGSPFTRTLPGTEHLANVVDNILTERWLVRDGTMIALEAAAIVGLGAAAIAAGVFLPAVAFGTAILACLAGWSALAALAFFSHVWLGAVFPIAALLAPALAIAAARQAQERRRRQSVERQRANLARYLPPAMVDRISRGERALADRTQYATILFIDIVGSVHLVETMAPAEAMAFLRAFHRRVESRILQHQGCVTAFLGDGALACFGLPEPATDDARRALQAARALAHDFATSAVTEDASAAAPVKIGMGVHHGLVLVGDLGGERQVQFTLVGDAVNVASRLQTLSRDYDAAIVVSDALVEAVRAGGGDVELVGFEAKTPQMIRGRDRPLGLWVLHRDAVIGAHQPRQTSPAGR